MIHSYVITAKQLETLRLFVADIEVWMMEYREAINKPYLTTSESAKRLGCSVRTVRRLVSTGQLTPIKFGAGKKLKHYRFRAEDLCALFEAQQ